MHFLITNDDGIEAPGLAALHRALSPLGVVSVVAPDREQSAGSHAVSLRSPIAVRAIERAQFGRAFAVEGTPADCVRLGVVELLADPVDWVVSGINPGANLGVDVYYSGTVAAAREAGFMGVRAAAVSHYVRKGGRDALDWDRAACLTADLIGQLVAMAPQRNVIWNINLPFLEPGQYPAAVRTVPLATPHFPLQFERTDPDESEHREYSYTVAYSDRPAPDGTDVATVFGGDIAVTPIDPWSRDGAYLDVALRCPRPPDQSTRESPEV